MGLEIRGDKKPMGAPPSLESLLMSDFIPHDALRAKDCSGTYVPSSDATLRAWIAQRQREADSRFARDVRTLFPRCTFADWSRAVSGTFERPTSLRDYRAARTHIATLRAVFTTLSHTESSDTARKRPTLTLSDGTTVYVNSSDATAVATLRAEQASARRLALRLLRRRRATLSNAYGGTLSAGITAPDDTRRRTLESAVPLSDTLRLFPDGSVTVTLSHNVIREDDGSLNPGATLALRRLQAANGRRKGR